MMEFKVLEETKNRIIFQLSGETHTFCNLLKQELQQLKGVQIATYKITHPMIGIPEFLVETKGAEIRKVLKEALTNLHKKVNDFQKEIASL